MSAESIKKLQSLATTTIAEKIIRPINLEVSKYATLDSAKTLDSSYGDFEQSANHYYSVFERSSEIEEKLEALFGLSQQLINLGRLGQAKQYLKLVEKTSINPSQSNERLKEYAIARMNEKLGWIADSEGNFKVSAVKFSLSRAMIEEIPENDRNLQEKQIHSTSVHFLGRAFFGLGKYQDAINYFNEHLENPELKKDEQAYGHGWLARCYLKLNKLTNARTEIEKTRELFTEYLDTHPERGVMANYHLVKGKYFIRTGDFSNARAEFNSALEIRHIKERSPKGESAALFGIAFTHWAEKNIGQAFVYAVNAIKTYPLSIIKPSL